MRVIIFYHLTIEFRERNGHHLPVRAREVIAGGLRLAQLSTATTLPSSLSRAENPIGIN